LGIMTASQTPTTAEPTTATEPATATQPITAEPATATQPITAEPVTAEPVTAEPTIAAELRGVGLRVTAARVALLEAVRGGDHLGVDAIATGVRDRVGHVSVQAVYEALHALTAAGLIRRIEPAGSPARFEGRVGDNHHHIVCRSCGVVADVDCAVGEAPCLTASDDHGFSIGEAEVIYWGLCPACPTVPSASASSAAASSAAAPSATANNSTASSSWSP
jgi:Fur family transcriptional regulator, stress-responsive regulator